MSDSGESIRGPHDSDLDWALRLRRIAADRAATFDSSLSLGLPNAVDETRQAVADQSRFGLHDINPYADESLPVLPDLADAQRLLAERNAAVMAGDLGAVAQELSFGLSQHIIDAAQGYGPQHPAN